MTTSTKIGVILIALILGWIIVYYQFVAPAMQAPPHIPGLELTANDTVGTTPNQPEDPNNNPTDPDPSTTNNDDDNDDINNQDDPTTTDPTNNNREVMENTETELPPSIPPPPITTTYVVKKDDTMQTIAKEWFGSVTKWVLIAQENPLTDPMKLRRGQILRLPAKDARPENIPPELYAQLTNEIKYTIGSGDTLSGIAKQFYGKPSLYTIIYNANRAVIANPDSLQEGVQITIPRHQQPAD